MQGNTLYYADGTRFVVKGTSAYMVPFYSNGSGGADGGLSYVYGLQYPNRDKVFSFMKSLGINTVRISVASYCYNDSTCGYNLGGKAGYLQVVKDYADSATAKGLYVVFGWWENGKTLPDKYTSYLPMMGDVVRKIGNNPLVMYEPWNEPYEISGAQWETVMNGTLDYYRKTLGYKGVLLIDTVDWSWSFGKILPNIKNVQAKDAALMGGQPNIIFANHRYANNNRTFTATEQSQFESEVTNYAQTYPIVGTEYGFFNGGGTYNPEWNKGFFAYITDTAVPKKGLNGGMIFNWSWVDYNSLTANDPLKLNEGQGDVAKDYFFAKLPSAPNK